jgi:hypothetical protein
MPWAINISGEHQKLLFEGIDCKLVAKHVDKILFQHWAIVFPDSQIPTASRASKFKVQLEHSKWPMGRISGIYNPAIILSLILLFLLFRNIISILFQNYRKCSSRPGRGVIVGQLAPMDVNLAHHRQS